MANEIVVQRLVVPIEGDTSGLERDFKKTGTMASTWATALGNIVAEGFLTLVRTAADLATGAIKEVLNVVKEGVDVAKDFESSLADLSIAAAKSDLTFTDLHDAAITVGGDTRLLGVSASGAAESMVNLYKAGLTTTQIFGDVQGYLAGTADLAGALRASIDLAAASELDMVAASELAATTIATFGWQAEEAGQSVDQWIVSALDNFVKAADASVADVGDLTAALVNVGPTASTFGFTLEDVNNALAILSTRGIKGAEAGTALKSMLTNIMRPTNQVQDALKALNIDLYDTDGALRSLPDILGSFEQSLMGVNEITTIVGGRTKEQQAELERLQKVYNRTATSIRDYESGVKGANLTETARQKKLKALQDTLKNAGIAIADLDAIQGTAITSTKALTEEQRNAAIQTLAGTFGMKAMQTLLTEGVEGWEAMALATEDAMGTQDQAAIKADTLNGALEALDGVRETLMIGIGEGLLPVLQDLALWAQDMASEYGPLVVDFFTQLGEKASTFFEILTETDFATMFADIASLDFSSLADFLTQLAEELEIPWLETVAIFLSETLPEAIQIASEFWNNVLAPSIAYVSNLFNQYLFPLLLIAWQWLAENIPAAIAIVSTWLQDNFGGAITAASEIVDAFFKGGLPEAIKVAQGYFLALAQTVYEWYYTYIFPVLDAFMQWWLENWPIIQAVAVTAWEVILAIIQTVIDIIINEVWPQIEEAIATLTEAMDAAGISWSDVWNAIKTAIAIVGAAIGAILLVIIAVVTSMINVVAGLIRRGIEFWVSLQTSVTAVMTGISQIIAGVMAIVRGIFENNWALFFEGWKALFTGITNLVGGFARMIVEIFTGLWKILLGLGSDFIEAMIEFFVDLYDNLVGESIIPEMVSEIISTFTDTDWLSIGKGIIDGIAEGIKGAVTSLAQQAASAAKAALKAAKAALGIESPSTVAAEEIGAPFAEGIGMGIEESANTLLESIDTLFAEVIPRVQQEAVTNVREGDTFNLDANYAYQDERTLIDQVRFMQLEQATPL